MVNGDYHSIAMKIGTSKNPVIFNFRSEKLSLSPEVVPTLVPAIVMDELQRGDSEPYFKLQAIKYPVEGTGVYPSAKATYTEEFWESFLGVCKQRPIPGSKRGHEFASRPSTDFYLVGGKLEKSSKGKGTVYLKNYVPPEGDTTSNAGLIRDMKAGIVHFSIVTMPKYETEGDEQHFTGSAGYERNDAVEYGVGAMEQSTNAGGEEFEILTPSIDNIHELIEQGAINARSSWIPLGTNKLRSVGVNQNDIEEFARMHLAIISGADPHSPESYLYPIGKNGTVYRSALRTIASRAANNGHDEISGIATDLISRMDEQRRTHNRRPNMERDEFLKLLANMKQNGELTLTDCAEAMGLKEQIVTDEQRAAVKIVNSLKELEVSDPVEEIKNLRAKLEAVDSDRVKNALDSAFGPEKDKDGKENAVRKYAGTIAAGVKAENIDAKIEELKKDAVMLKLAGDRADFTSPENQLGIVDQNDTAEGADDGPTVVEY